MRATQVLDEVQAKGVTLVVDGNNLRCKGSKAVVTPQLIAELREHKSEILSLAKCGRCRAPLAGPVNKFWRVLNDGQSTYLCSAECVFGAYPWRLEVAHDNRH
jgi:hypothetical protein